ncbi:MAG: protein-L-isoaspartate(D-aspartate) O-methyltransferase [Candidatus Margulisiibacteriota bacterium]
MPENLQQIQRDAMVEVQLHGRGISDKRVLQAFRRVPRHFFIPKNMANEAYFDCALPIGNGQTISQPYMVAIMTELLKLTGKETVLEIGTGSGYQAAILCELAKHVISLERIPDLADHARRLLVELGYKNFEVMVADGTQGWKEKALYDRILVTAAAEKIPQPLIDQLKEGGRLIIPLGQPDLQILTIVEKIQGKIVTQQSIGCVFVPLISET